MRIEEDESGHFFLYWDSSNPHYMSSDSWHQTLEDALAQAKTSFGVDLNDWLDA